MADVLDDLAAEYRQLDAVLAALSPAQWSAPSGEDGWTVADVVLHLAQSEEAVGSPAVGSTGSFLPSTATTVDGAMADLVAAERGMPPDALLARWRKAAFATPDTLRSWPPGTRLVWVRTSLSPRTLATTRLAE